MATTRSQPKPKARSQAKPKEIPKVEPKDEPEPAHRGTRSFFEGLQERGHEPILKGESGTIRFDLSGGPQLERWYITIADGNVTVSHRNSRADAVVRVDGELFNRIALGTANLMTAYLRGVLVVEGDLHLLMAFQRLFPGPPRSSTAHRPVTAAGTEVPRR